MRHARSAQKRDTAVKLGIDIDPQDMELLRIAADTMGHTMEETLSLALAWGCERLREACPFPLPVEAGGDLPGLPRVN